MSEHTKFRLIKIIRIENCFHQEFNQRKILSKKLSKYVTAFDYIEKILIVLTARKGGDFITGFGAPVGIASASFALSFSLTKGKIKKLLNITRKKKEKA